MTRFQFFPGLVIHYEFDFGRDSKDVQMLKDRPAVVVVATGQGGNDRVILVPISHTPPYQGQYAIEIPAPLKNRLGLDSDRSWIKLDELNDTTVEDLMYDIRKTKAGNWEYGILPQGLLKCIQDGINASNRLVIHSRNEKSRSMVEIKADLLGTKR